MIETILVPVDLTDRHGPVVDLVAELIGSRQAQCRVTLLHVIEQIEDVPDSQTERVYAVFRKRAERVLGGLEKRFAEHGISVRKEILIGKRAPEIVAYASLDHSDLIVLGAHLADLSEGRRTLGTISHQVAIWAPCSVHLVR